MDPTLPEEVRSEGTSMVYASHVKLLESAGAFVVPLDFTQSSEQLKKSLHILNGLYIPGDTPFSKNNEQYGKVVKLALEWALARNVHENTHFPVVAVSHGYILAMKSMAKQAGAKAFTESSDALAWSKPRQLRLAKHPDDTFMYDGRSREEVFHLFNGITVSTDELGEEMTVARFLKDRKLSRVFAPIATFQAPHLEDERSEIVAVVEGISFPFFGIAYRIDAPQFVFATSLDSDSASDRADHSASAQRHCQRLANLLVDEAKHNTHTFPSEEELDSALIQNHDLVVYRSNGSIVELYVFE